jgi:hypothetical protein
LVLCNSVNNNFSIPNEAKRSETYETFHFAYWLLLLVLGAITCLLIYTESTLQFILLFWPYFDLPTLAKYVIV